MVEMLLGRRNFLKTESREKEMKQIGKVALHKTF